MAFSPNPLSLAIPPKELQRWYSEQVLLRLSTSSQPAAQSPLQTQQSSGIGRWASGGSSREAPSGRVPEGWPSFYREAGADGAPLYRVQWGAASSATKPWSSQFLALEQFPEGYSAPSTVDVAKWRLQRNVLQYWGNYLCIFGVTLLCTLYKQPVALLGLYLLWRLMEELTRLEAGFSLNGTWRRLATRFFIYALVLMVAYTFKVVFVGVLATTITLALVAVHGVLREPSTDTQTSSGR